MKTIVLATNRPEVREAFLSFPSWEAMGYAPPRIFSNAPEAMESIRMAPPDAVAIDLSKEQGAPLYDLLQGYPHTVYMKAASDPHALALTLEELTGMLARTSVQEGAAQSFLPELRTEFLQTLLDGLIASGRVLTHRLEALDLLMYRDVPCVLVRFELPGVTRYVSEVWRYGRTRLGLAMLKFFQPEAQDTLVALSSFTEEGMRLLYLPPKQLPPGMLLPAAEKCARQAMDDMAEYLGLEVVLMEMREIAGLQELLVANA